MKIKTKPIILLIFGFFTLVLLNNLLHFPPRGSYDASSHHTYANTLLTQKRYPVREETPHFHNPPTWYLLGSGSIWLTEKLFGYTDWRLSIKPWQMTNLLFGLGGLIIWFKIAQIFFKKDLKKILKFYCLFIFFPSLYPSYIYDVYRASLDVYFFFNALLLSKVLFAFKN